MDLKLDKKGGQRYEVERKFGISTLCTRVGLQMIYFDNAASQKIRKEALETLNEGLKNCFANPSAKHKFGQSLLKKIEDHRNYFTKTVKGKDLYDFVFTSSATESNNMALLSFDFKEGDVAYISSSEHPSLIGPLKECEKRGLVIKELPLDESGILDQETFFQNLDSKVILVALSHVNNQSGVIQPVEEFSQRLKKIKEETKIHVDATQSFSKLSISLFDQYIDYMTVSSHKLGGPKGIAGIYVKKGVSIKPLLYGGGQEKNLRSSTQSFPLISSFTRAVKEGMDSLEGEYNRVDNIYKKIRTTLKENIPEVLFPFSSSDKCKVSPYILTFVVPNISSDIILRHMEQEEIYLSSTSACSSKVKGENTVFKGLGIDNKYHKNVLRISFSNETTWEEGKIFCEKLKNCIDEMSFLMPKKK